jgi:FlaA1/EpsC-like NDP-sugar epimerase
MATHMKELFINSWHHPGFRATGKLGLDTLGLAVAWGLALAAQSGQPSALLSRQALAWMAVALASNLAFRLPSQHFRHFGRRDQGRVLAATGVLALASLLLSMLPLRAGLAGLGGGPASAFPGGTPLLAALATGLVWIALRMGVALLHERRRSRAHGQNTRPAPADRVLIAGAGHAGLLILEELARHPELGHQVVGLVDDAPDKQGLRVAGVQVLGRFQALPELIRRHAVTRVILAVPSAPGEVVRHLTRLVSAAGAEVKTVPGLFDLLGARAWVPEVQDVAIEDLLRRAPVQLDQTALGRELADAVVLITGGGGSIGSELARQVAAFHPRRIVLLGRGENSLWEAERRLRRHAPGQQLSVELCDIRNPLRLQQAFERWRPGVVFHAAAHKHVPYLELHPSEGIQNNVFGTLNVVRACQGIGVHTFVNISTDKAVNPANVLGATKYLAECIIQAAASTALPGQRYVSVRFGNVLGSRGSVIPVFQDQIRSGGPLTVTHPDMTRYFMTIPEASQLVLQAGLLGRNGKIFVLDMGEPVRIGDLARDMARLSGLTVGRDIQIQFSGIRPGEKLFEEIFHAQEERPSRVHPKVFEAMRRPLAPGQLEQGIEALALAVTLPDGDRQREILHWLKRLVPSYRPSPTGLGRYDTGSALPPAPVALDRAGSRSRTARPLLTSLGWMGLAAWRRLARRILVRRVRTPQPVPTQPWRVA